MWDEEQKSYPLGGGAGGNRGPVIISSWRCNFSIYLDIQVYYLDIQAITTLYAFYWLFMCCFLLFNHFSTLQPLSWKVTFSGTKKIIEPQFSTYRHWTGFIVKRKQVRISPCLSFPLNWLVFFYFNFESCLFWHKKIREL